MKTWTGCAMRSIGLLVFVAALLVLHGGTARADGTAPALHFELAQRGPAPPALELPAGIDDVRQLHENGRRMRRAGNGLVLAGAIAVTLGAAAIVSDFLNWEHPNRYGLVVFVSGCVLTTGGHILLATGIPLRVVGRDRMRRAEAMGYVPTASLAPALQLGPRGPTSAGVELRITF